MTTIAQPVAVPPSQFTPEQVKIAALICLSNAQAYIAHGLHLLTSTDTKTDDVLNLLAETARASSHISSTLLKIRAGE